MLKATRKTDTQLTLFDYTQLETSDRDFCQERAERIKERNKRMAIDIWENGRDFAEVQKRLAKPGRYSDGIFVKWAEHETRYSHQTVYRFIHVYQKINFNKLLKIDVATSALYQLTAPSTPEAARQEALERAETGENITNVTAREIIAEHKAPGVRARMEVHYSSATPEWNTPQDIINRVLQVLGAIDLDPCSNNHNTPNVPAETHYTKENDGLSKSWSGRVYMNPPYGREIANWVNYLCKEWERGEIEAAIALVPSRTDTRWFRQLRAFPRCFIWGRLRFSNNGLPAPFPSMAVYLGSNREVFTSAFRDIGDIYEFSRE